MGSDEFLNFLNEFEAFTKKPEKYISVQDEEAEQIKVLTKKLYDFSKIKEFPSKQTEALSKLVIANLDDEQIWQQIELNNNSLYNNLVNYTARLLALKSKLKFPLKKKEVQEQINGKRKDENKDNCHADSTSESEEIETDEEKGKKNSLKKSNKSSIVDDKFFKLHEMEEFLEKVESKNDNDNDNEDDEFINYFVESSSDSDIENQPKYNDFFDEPEGEEKNHKKKRKLSTEIKETKGEKKVKFALNDNSDTDENYSSNEENLLNDSNKNGDAEEYSEDMGSEEVSDNDSGDEKENENDKKNEPPSTFELRQERLKSRISALEEKALKAKPWQMKGEITADDRPQNSLLEEYVEFDVAVRPAPVLTEKSTLKLEDIIIQRIKDKAWDDVVRKIKPIENEIEYKKKLVLDQEKSKLSLAQIYEQEYLKQVENKATEDVIDKPEIEPPEHVEIKSLLKNLFVKLDALSNFHFTPTPVSAEVKIISNLPAIVMEEVTPVATSDAALLAPEEVKTKSKGNLIGKSERTATDKKRERRQKKLRQRLKFKKIEEKAKSKIENVKNKNVQSKNLSTNLLQKITKSSNVTSLKESDGKYIKSSSTFFSKLQDETNSMIKKKNLELGKSKFGNKLKSKKYGKYI